MQKGFDSHFPLSIFKSPMLNNVVLNNIAEYMDWECLKTGREVCSTWKEAFTPKFQMCSQTQANLTSLHFSKDFLSKFQSTLSLNGLYLIVNPEKNFMYPSVKNWFRSYGSQVTRLTIGNSIEKLFELEENSFNRLFEEYCPNIKYLTLVNFKGCFYDYDLEILQDLEPSINLTELKIISTRLVENCSWHGTDLIPCGIAENFVSIHRIKVQFNAKNGEFCIWDEDDVIINWNRWGYKLFKNVAHLSLEAKNEDSKYILNLKDDIIFPNLKSFCIQSKGIFINNFTPSDNCPVQFPKLEILALPNPVKFDNFILRFPILKELQLSDLNNSTSCVTKFDVFAHPNVQKLKVNLNTIKFETVFDCFPKLKCLEVDLSGRKLSEELTILCNDSTLKELTIIDNSIASEFESAIELHFSKLLMGLQKLSIKTLNTEENRGPNLLNIFAQHGSKAPSDPILTSVTLQGFKICSQQYDLLKHQLPFHLLILR